MYQILYSSCSNKNSNVSRSLVIPVWFQVDTTKGVFSCRKVIVTAGAWTNYVLESVGVHVPIYVTQEQVTYLAISHMKQFTKNRYFVIQIHVLLKPASDVHFSCGYQVQFLPNILNKLSRNRSIDKRLCLKIILVRLLNGK